MDQVNETGVEIVITKRNEPIAKLVPVAGELRPFVGRSRGVIQISDEDLLAPVGEDWEVDADL
jgi:antitoxin (DNA-binding transcriptional repressor) of toxin-antitoxin stability system